MSGVANLKHVFGYRTGISGSVVFSDEQTIVYPCGSNLVLYNIEQKSQKFIAGLEKSQGMTAIAISPNRRYIALAEKTSDKPVVTIYDLQALRKKKSLHTSDVHSSEFVSVAFSPDSKYLAVQGGHPDWILTYWSWEKPKQLASIRTSVSNPVKQISFSPHDCTLICVVGTDIFRLYRYGENNLKTYGLIKVELRNFLCHTWINDEKIVVGTEDGRWILIENGEPKVEYQLTTTDEADNKGGNQEGKDIEEVSTKVKNSITALASTSKGLAVACSPGLVHWFEHIDPNSSPRHYSQQQQQQQQQQLQSDAKYQQKDSLSAAAGKTSMSSQVMRYPSVSVTGGVIGGAGGAVATTTATVSSKDEYKLLRSIHIPYDPAISIDSEFNVGQNITQLVISPSEDFIIATTDTHQIYQFNLNSVDLSIKGGDLVSKKNLVNAVVRGQNLPKDTMIFEPVSQSFHNGQILGMDVCMRKPLIATCATDRTVRIWNYETNDLELTKQFAEEAFSIALHPSGLYVLVGFSDKLRLMNILIDDIRTFHEFTIRGCRECAFSNGGHLLAAVNGNVIQIYSVTTFENVTNLKGHNGKIRSIVWSDDDNKLISCGMDGAVYEWDPQKGTRINESVLKACGYTSVTVSQDAKTLYAVGSDKTLKEISDSQIIREIESPDVLLTTVAVSRSGRMLFCGCQNGHIKSFHMPLTERSDWQDYIGHCGSVTKARMAATDDYLITVSDDCSVMIWRIQDREARSNKAEKEIVWAEEILITKSDLEEKNLIMSELKTRVEELKMENEYQLRLKDMNYNERIKELTEKFIQEMETLKTKNQLLKTEKEREENHHLVQLQEVIEKHSQELQNLESISNQKLIIEYEKYQELQNLAQRKEIEYEKQLNDMETNKERLLHETTEFYESKINDKNIAMENLTRELKEQTNEYEISKRLIEEDTDREILEIKIKYEKRLRDEREVNARLKGESGIMKKKFSSLQKEIDDHKEEIKKFHAETQKLNTVIRNQEKDIQGLRKEVQERDETIQDKEKRIYDLKKKNQELEKFKYVLDYKIRELKKQIEPRENDIKNYKEQIQEMEGELERFHKQNDQLEINIAELKQKYKSVEHELKLERQATRDVESLVRRLKTDLFNCVGFIQEPKQLKAGILALYRKHIHEDMAVDATADADIQKEFSRQREHLERSVIGLRQKLARDSEMHRADYIRIMQENVSLIQEINNLRTELKAARNHINDLEAALGLNRKDGDKARQLLIQVNKSRPNPVLEADYEQAQRALAAQQDLIDALQMKLDSYIQAFSGNNSNDLLKDLQSAAHSPYTKSPSAITTTTTTVQQSQSRPYSNSNILPPINNGGMIESTEKKTSTAT
uniref:WD_REPEATS_REGION domain-containing protein n=1 Tax=Trichobilharzia regenti TaxID=157069 RepID=A0AA85KMR2_TRIRE|nr:unnamed protein product [Trichobilharzia regenti]